MLQDQWPNTERKEISWLLPWLRRAASEKAIAMIVDRDGMQDFRFEESVVAILVDVPPYLERNLPSEGYIPTALMATTIHHSLLMVRPVRMSQCSCSERRCVVQYEV